MQNLRKTWTQSRALAATLTSATVCRVGGGAGGIFGQTAESGVSFDWIYLIMTYNILVVTRSFLHTFPLNMFKGIRTIHNNGLWFFPSIRTSVRSCVPFLIFCMYMDIGERMPIFAKSRSKVKVKNPQKRPFLDQCWIQRLGKGLIRTREGHVGYFWQRANYVWHLAKCCRRTGGFL